MQDNARNIIEKVSIHPEYMHRYPHEFSGGQRQRICIARALTLKPKLLICDEPTSALDISIQSQILNLLKELQKEYNMSYIFISHNLDVIYYMSDFIIVMYMGSIMEQGDAEEIFYRSKHPYTQFLTKSIPSDNPEKKNLENFSLKGEISNLKKDFTGCPFYSRCERAFDICKTKRPERINIEKNHEVSCWLYK